MNLENKTIEAYVGIYINGKLEEIPYGTYIIQKPDNEELQQKTNFIGYDYMLKFNVPYKDRIKYPIKASELLADVCNQVGLEVGNTDFTNSDYMILGNPFNSGEDCRTVLSNIAQLAGTFAKIGRDNKVYIPTLKNSSKLLTVKYVDAMTVKELDLTQIKVLSGEADNAEETLDGYNYGEDFGKNNQWGGLNSLVLAVSDVEGENTALDDKGDIEENGLSEITIQDNYFLIDQAEREKVIVPLWNMLKGLKYLPFKTSYYGYPYLDAGDMIYLYDTKDNGYVSYIFNHSFTYNGAFSGSLETEAMTKTQTAYKNTFSLKSKVRKVELSVNKINGEIKAIVESQDELGKLVSSVTITVGAIDQSVTLLRNDNEEIKASLDLKIDKDELISEINASADRITLNAGRLIITSGNFKLDANGNITAVGGTIGGFTLGSDKFSSKLSGIYNYTMYDAMLSYMLCAFGMNNLQPFKNIYDYNDSGVFDLIDVDAIFGVVQNGETNTHVVSGDFIINTKDPKNCIMIKQGGYTVVSIGTGGINSDLIGTKFLCISDNSYSKSNTNCPGIYVDGNSLQIMKISKNYKEEYVRFEKTLYSNSSGSTGTIDLNDSISNYSSIEIYYSDDQGNIKCEKIHNNKSSSAKVLLSTQRQASDTLDIQSSLITISGSTISHDTSHSGTWTSWDNKIVSGTRCSIKKVVGYE